MENIRLAFQGIWGHKMRSMLTMLGIIIGISAIITIVSTIKGTNEQIKENLVGAGSNVVTVRLYQDEWEYDFAIIGISAIITIVSTIKGTNEQIKENLVGAGSNVVTVRLYQDEWEYDFAYSPLPPNVRPIDEATRRQLEELPHVSKVSLYNSYTGGEGVFAGANMFTGEVCGNVRPIDEATRRQLEELPHVSKVSLYNSYTGGEGVFAGANMFTGEVCGIDLNYMDVYGYLTAYGRSFTQRDFDQYRKVAVVDRELHGCVRLFDGLRQILHPERFRPIPQGGGGRPQGCYGAVWTERSAGRCGGDQGRTICGCGRGGAGQQLPACHQHLSRLHDVCG